MSAPRPDNEVVTNAAAEIGRAFKHVIDACGPVEAAALLADVEVAVKAAIAREHGKTVALGLGLVAQVRGVDRAAEDAAEVVGNALRFVLEQKGPRACSQIIDDAAAGLLIAVAALGGAPNGELH